MCIYTELKKVTTFEEVVLRLIDWETLKKSPDTIREANRKLEGYSMTRYMKLLYFLCIADAMPEGSRSLLKTFNSFKAYQYGPVEEGIYLRRTIPGAFVYFGFDMDRRILQFKDANTDMVEKRREAVAGVFTNDKIQFDAIDSAIEVLGGKQFLTADAATLVSLSHSLEAWQQCYYYDQNQGDMSAYLASEAERINSEIEGFKDLCI